MARFGPLYHTRRARRNPGRSAGPGKETFILSDTQPVSAASDSDRLLGQAPIGSLILKLSLPAVAAQLINVLYNVVDRMYIGNIPDIGATALTGVGVTFPVLMIVSAFAAFAGMGGAPLAGIRLGAGDKDGAEQILGNCFSLLLALSVALTVVFQLLRTPILVAFGATGNLLPYAEDYISIYLWGTVSVQLALGLNTFISAQGRSGTAMLSVAIGAVLNIVLDPLFIFVFDMGVKGAAIATVLSQTVSAVWVLAFLLSGRSTLRIRRKNLRFSAPVLASVAALGVSPFIMQSTESLVTITLNRGMAQYGGELYMGTITILQSVMQLIVLPLQGLTQGTQPIISYNYGAKNLDRVRATFKRVFLISMIYAISAFALVCLLAWPLSRMFTSDAALIDLTVKAMPVFFGGIWAFGAQMSCQAAFMGLGQAKVSLFLALLRKVILLIPLAIVLPMVLGGDPFAIYLAEPASDFIASATTLTIFLLFYKRTLNRPAD